MQIVLLLTVRGLCASELQQLLELGEGLEARFEVVVLRCETDPRPLGGFYNLLLD